MLAIEKLKRYFLLYDLSEPFQLIDFIGFFENFYKFNNSNERNIKILEVIKYFLEDDIFEIGEDWSFTKWPSNNQDTLLKIKFLLDSGEDLIFKAFFNLTPKGRQEALDYLDKQNIVKEKILLSCQDNVLDIDKVMPLIQEVFETNDSEEIEYEFLDCIASLADWHFIEIITLIDNNFQTLKYSVYPEPFENKIKEQLEYEKKSQLKSTMFCKITPNGQLVLDEWKKSGGKISDYFYKSINHVNSQD